MCSIDNSKNSSQVPLLASQCHRLVSAISAISTNYASAISANCGSAISAANYGSAIASAIASAIGRHGGCMYGAIPGRLIAP